VKPYCITVVKYVLPAMRVLITSELMEKYGLRKIDVAEKMSLTPAAVTQYSKGIRGSSCVEEISESKEIMEKISEISRAVSKDDSNIESLMDRMCEVCRLIRSEKLICKLHANELTESMLDDCRMCLKNES
jgi:predicted transcriptional regulator